MRPFSTSRPKTRPCSGIGLFALLVFPSALHTTSEQELTLVNPVPGSWIAAFFGDRVHPVSGAVVRHGGVDLIAPRGTDVRTAAAGTVADATSHLQGESRFGLVVTVDHGGGYMTIYAHLGEIRVRPGQVISAGEIVGTVGSVGTARQPVLHFEVRNQGLRTDPAAYVDEWQNGAPAGD